jgi:outer membrane murein-binding lipoprotein Lpp
MTRALWLIVIGGVLAGGAVLIGVLANSGGESQADARQAFCTSVHTLRGSIDGLTGLSPTSASKSDYQSAVDQVQSDWDAVKSDASDLKDVTISQLSSDWDSFESAVQAVPDDASVSDALDSIKSATQTLATSVSSTLSGPDCS